MALMGNERVQISVSGGSQVAATEFPLASGRGHVQRMLSFLEQQSAVGTTPIDIAISEFAQRFRRRGLVLILSDFMTSGDLNRAFNMLYRAGLEIHALQILSEDELTPDLSGDLRLVDCETGATLDLSAAEELAQRYQESLAQQQELLADACRRRMGRFLRVSSQCTVDEVAVGQWCRAGWIQ